MKFKIRTILVFLFCVIELFAQENNNLFVEAIGEYNQQRKLVIKQNGKPLIFEKVLAPYTSVPDVSKLSNGNLAFVYGIEGIIEFCDKNGNLLSTQYFYKRPPYEEQALKHIIINNGLYLVISENRKNNIYYLDNEGTIKNSFEVPYGLLSGFTVSKKENHIAYSTNNWDEDNLKSSTYIYNKNLEIISQYNFAFEKGDFNETENLFLAQNKFQIYLISVKANDIIWKENLETEEVFLKGFFDNNEVIFIKAETPIFIEKKWQYNKGEILKKSINGKLLFERKITEPFESIELVKTEKNVLVKTSKEVIRID